MRKEMIYTGDYALIVSDEKPIEEQYFLFDPDSLVFKADSTEYGEDAVNIYGVEYVESFTDDIQFNVRYCKTVIGHRPLTDAPILEGVPLLPDFTQENSNKELYFQKQVMNPYTTGGQSYTAYEKGFIEGWSKAKETYKYTEEDLRKAFLEGNKYPQESKLLPDFYLGNFYNKFIQSLQQPKRPKSILLEKIENNICVGQYFFD